MTRENLIELTAKLYRLTLLFPKKEPLRYKAREHADDFLATWILRENIKNQVVTEPSQNKEIKAKELIFDLENSIEVIRGFLDVAKWQNWVNFFQVLEIQQEYDKIRLEIKEEIRSAVLREEIKNLTLDLNASTTVKDSLKIEVEKPIEPAPIFAKEMPNVVLAKLDERKQRIVEFLKEKGRAQVQDLKDVLPKISKRTLRRDFQFLLKEGMVERMGDKNNTFYQIKRWDNDRTEINFGMS